jgi:hypothetical protein
MSQSGHGTVFVLGGILLVVGDSTDDDDDDDDVMIFSTSDEDDDSTNDAERDDKLGNSFDCCCDDVANKTVRFWGSTDKEERLLTAMMEKADDVDRSRNRNVVALHQ